VALWDYVPQRGDELAVRAGDPLWLLEEATSGWWRAQRVDDGAAAGLIPNNYVEIRPAPHPTLAPPVPAHVTKPVSVAAAAAATGARRPPPVVGPSPAALASSSHQRVRARASPPNPPHPRMPLAPKTTHPHVNAYAVLRIPLWDYRVYLSLSLPFLSLSASAPLPGTQLPPPVPSPSPAAVKAQQGRAPPPLPSQAPAAALRAPRVSLAIPGAAVRQYSNGLPPFFIPLSPQGR
jgi:hypothetical protein